MASQWKAKAEGDIQKVQGRGGQGELGNCPRRELAVGRREEALWQRDLCGQQPLRGNGSCEGREWGPLRTIGGCDAGGGRKGLEVKGTNRQLMEREEVVTRILRNSTCKILQGDVSMADAPAAIEHHCQFAKVQERGCNSNRNKVTRRGFCKDLACECQTGNKSGNAERLSKRRR